MKRTEGERETVTEKKWITLEREKKKDERREQKVRNEWRMGPDDTSSFKVTLFVM